MATSLLQERNAGMRLRSESLAILFGLACLRWSRKRYAAAPGTRGSACRSPRGRSSPPRNRSRQYEYPEWFRDAKLGIWAHWGPQAVPMFGDWYARQIYQQGHPQYKDHLEHYGHPIEVRLQGHHPALEGREVGPRPADGALQEGRRALLREHGRAPRQLRPLELDAPQVERREDGAAPRRGGRLAEGREEARPAVRRLRAPGRQLHLVPGQPPLGQDGPAGRRSLRRRRPEVPGPLSLAGRARRHGLVQQGPALAPRVVRPDQGPGRSVPARPALHRRRRALRQRGRPEPDRPSLQRHARRRNGGKADVVYTCKQKSEGRWVEDLERGVMPGIRPYPWQTDTSIGDWYYNRNWKYRGDLGDPHARRHRQQERQPADQRRPAPTAASTPRPSRCSRRWPTGSRSTARGSTRPAPG